MFSVISSCCWALVVFDRDVVFFPVFFCLFNQFVSSALVVNTEVRFDVALPVSSLLFLLWSGFTSNLSDLGFKKDGLPSAGCGALKKKGTGKQLPFLFELLPFINFLEGAFGEFQPNRLPRTHPARSCWGSRGWGPQLAAFWVQTRQVALWGWQNHRAALFLKALSWIFTREGV